MLAIARGLMARPQLLMLDEPSWGIAPKFVTKVLEVIQQVNAPGVSVLLVEQNLHKALAIADYGYVIQTGRIVLEGPGRGICSTTKRSRRPTSDYDSPSKRSPMTPTHTSPTALRLACRRGNFGRPTAGQATAIPGQPGGGAAADADDFLRFCQLNPSPAP